MSIFNNSHVERFGGFKFGIESGYQFEIEDKQNLTYK